MVNPAIKRRYIQSFSILSLLLSSMLTLAYSNAIEKHFSSGNNKVLLVELFTSEGCSSCPPAEKWMNSLKDDPRLWNQFVPVAFHVDYWDYIGWKDPYATSDNGIRQRKYKQQGNLRTVYTPGMILDGKEWRSWHYKRHVPPTGESVGNLDVMVNGDDIIATFVPVAEQSSDWELNVAILGFQLRSNVSAGENSGRRLDQEFVVLAHETMTSSNGKWKMKLPNVKKEYAQHTGLAVWVNKKGLQTPVQATGGWLSEQKE